MPFFVDRSLAWRFSGESKFACSRFALPSTYAAVPGKPGVPRCNETTATSITLHWQPPSNDGGKLIIKYIVEIRVVGSATWITYVSSLNTSTLDSYFSVRVSLWHVVCSSLAECSTGKFPGFLPFL